jgi:hypothetical protein
VGEHVADFLVGQDHGQSPRSLGADYVAEDSDLLSEHLVQEDQRAERLVLRRRADVPAHGQVRQEGLDLFRAQLGRMAQLVEEDLLPYPLHVSLFGAWAVLAHPASMARFDRGRADTRAAGGGVR